MYYLINSYISIKTSLSYVVLLLLLLFKVSFRCKTFKLQNYKLNLLQLQLKSVFIIPNKVQLHPTFEKVYKSYFYIRNLIQKELRNEFHVCTLKTTNVFSSVS